MQIKWIGAYPKNYEVGRRGKTIKWIIMHWIVGTLQSADAAFNSSIRIASAHYGIGQNEIHQYVKEENTAYHAGNFDVNLQSIGIEHEGSPDIPITDAVYKQSAELVAMLCKKYNIPFDRVFIRKHSEIKPTQCPGTLDIDKIIREAKIIAETPPDTTDWKKKYEEEHIKAEALYQDKIALLNTNKEVKFTLRDIVKKLKTE